MNSRIVKKYLINLTLSLITLITLISCASTNSREIAGQKSVDPIVKNDGSKTEDGGKAPHRFHSKRFEEFNKY